MHVKFVISPPDRKVGPAGWTGVCLARRVLPLTSQVAFPSHKGGAVFSAARGGSYSAAAGRYHPGHLGYPVP
jgi:hypothetical protein